MIDIFSPTLLFVLMLVVIINLIALISVGIDKNKSFNSEEYQNSRTPEINFFLWAVFFGSAGILAGMLLFRHKTKKLKFIFGISIILLQQIALIYLFISNNY